MKLKKKLLVAVFLLLMFVFTACENGNEDNQLGDFTEYKSTVSKEETTTEKENKKVKYPFSSPQNLIAVLTSEEKYIYNISWDKLSPETAKNLKTYCIEASGRILTDEGEVKPVTVRKEVPKSRNSVKIDFSNAESYDSEGNKYNCSFVKGTDVTVKIYGKTAKGKEGEKAEFTLSLQNALDSVLTADVSLNPDKNSNVKENDFAETGFTVSVKKNDDADKCRFTADIYAADGKTLLKSIYKRDDLKVMKLDEKKECFTYLLDYKNGINSEYAGSILRLSFQLCSEGRLSSPWSETIDFVLPKISVNPVDMNYSLGSTEYKITAFSNRGESEWGDTYLNQDTLFWDMENYTSGYRVNLISYDFYTKSRVLDVLKISFDSENSGSFYDISPNVTWLNGEDALSLEAVLTTSAGRFISPDRNENGDLFTLSEDGLNKTFVYSLDSRETAVLQSDESKNALGFTINEKLEITVEGKYEKYDTDDAFTDLGPSNYEGRNIEIKNISFKLLLPDGSCTDENGKLRKMTGGSYVKSLAVESNAVADSVYADSGLSYAVRNQNGKLLPIDDAEEIEKINQEIAELFEKEEDAINNSTIEVTER